MSYIESYQCDVCGDKKGEGGDPVAASSCAFGWREAPLRGTMRWNTDGSVDDSAACRSGFSL